MNAQVAMLALLTLPCPAAGLSAMHTQVHEAWLIAHSAQHIQRESLSGVRQTRVLPATEAQQYLL